MTMGPWIAVLLVLAPLPGKADIYDRLSGTFGDPLVQEESCDTNPVFSRFTADHSRVTFNWTRPVLSYTGAMITAFGGTLVATAPDSISILRDSETRITRDGAKIVWIMRATDDGYCWTRADMRGEACQPVLRCTPRPNS